MEPETMDFTCEITEGHIAVPPELAAQVRPGAQVRVIISWGSLQDDAAWRETGRRQFEAAYADEDGIYESLIDDTSTR
ncbi:MAG: hypothetical protein J0H49_02310 [Acidobacteria bacterium]|nr:hypothetical protein [Acidobacteriota bacterium]